MKKKTYRYRSILIVTATTLMMIFGCQRDILDFQQSVERDLSIEEAQGYFMAKYPESESQLARISGGDTSKMGRNARWDRAYNRKSTHGEAVVVPLESKNEKIYTSGGDKVFEFDQLNYIFMYKDAKKLVHTEHVTLMPSDDWVKGDQKLFTGNILVDSWDHKERRVYTFDRNGSTSSEEIVGPGRNTKPKNGRVNFVIYQVCMTLTQDCGTYALGTPGPNGTIANNNNGKCTSTHCKFVFVDEEPWGGVTGTAGTGGFGSEMGMFHNFFGHSGGGGTASPGNYVPICNPNIPPGTQVGPNEIPPCQTYTPVLANSTPGGIPMNFTAKSPEPYIFFDEGDPEALWWDPETVSGFEFTHGLALPSYSEFYANYPKDPNNTAADLPAQQVYEMIGGRVLQLRVEQPAKYVNACALRISRALNYCVGHLIPQIASQTVKGADGRNYFTSASKLWHYLMIKYKTSPKTILNTSDGGDYGMLFKGKLQPKKGIYIMKPVNQGPDGYGASGHATIFTGINCIGTCAFAPPNPADQAHGVEQITLFELE